LVQLAYRNLVDDDVLAAEQVRIRHERALVAKWAVSATRDADEIAKALEEALKLLNDPGNAYLLATPIARRMFNQAVFQRLEIVDDEVTGSVPTPSWPQSRPSLATAKHSPEP
jgi:hypothetical protein